MTKPIESKTYNIPDPDEAEELEPKRKVPAKIVQRYEDLPSDWKQIMYDLAADGASDHTLFTALSMTRKKHESLAKHYEDYAEWFEYCHEVSIAWWSDFGKKVCMSKNYNGGTYNMIVSNKLGWLQRETPPPHPEKPADKPAETKAEPGPAVSLDSFKNPNVETH